MIAPQYEEGEQLFTFFVQSQTIIFLFFYNQYVYRQQRHWQVLPITIGSAINIRSLRTYAPA
ncbi:hypothetical protein CUZ56_02605 [Saezia sanguinis]|uniref:Uncharacterized protein n=1 Tax=Saezia sanguinis TaxID=1965230 RepID=A0A433SAK1_9BURK|nr:hypothetical protein CUZ56_02605 [Saezia sanguinis]